jgi:hypothetical protein
MLGKSADRLVELAAAGSAHALQCEPLGQETEWEFVVSLAHWT